MNCSWDFASSSEVDLIGFQALGAGGRGCDAASLQLVNPTQGADDCGWDTRVERDADGVYLTPHLGCNLEYWPVRYELSASRQTAIRAIFFGWVSEHPALPFTAKLSCQPGAAPVEVAIRAGAIPVRASGEYGFNLPSAFVLPGAEAEAACQLELSSGRALTHGRVSVKRLSQVALPSASPAPPKAPSPPPL